MLKCFGDLIGWTVEAYMDDTMVKSKWVELVIADLEQTFVKLWANGIKLNPEKCVFGDSRGMLLGFIVFEHGIEAKLEKILAIAKMGLIQNIKGVQWVTGCLVSQNRPICKSTITIATTKAVKPSHLSPYKSGSPSSITKDLNSTNIQAKIIHDSTQPVTCYITVHK